MVAPILRMADFTRSLYLQMRAPARPLTRDTVIWVIIVFALLALVLFTNVFVVFALLALVLWFLFLIGGVLLVVGHDDNRYAVPFNHKVR